MSQPILTIDQSESKPKAVANLLPCMVHHNGQLDDINTFWSPADVKDGRKEAYFRGRKLHGKTLGLPEQYRGIVVERQPKSEKPAHEAPDVIDVDNTDDGPETGTMRVTAEFDNLVVWGHEFLADASGDPFVRGLEEWLQVADKVHDYDTKQDDGEKQA